MWWKKTIAWVIGTVSFFALIYGAYKVWQKWQPSSAPSTKVVRNEPQKNPITNPNLQKELSALAQSNAAILHDIHVLQDSLRDFKKLFKKRNHTTSRKDTPLDKGRLAPKDWVAVDYQLRQ